MTAAQNLHIRPIAPRDKASEHEVCAQLMAGSEPWITLGRDVENCRALVGDTALEKHGAFVNGELAGFIGIVMQGAFVGYIRVVCVAPAFRGQGVGSALVRFAEERIFRESPNVFLCVSSFNHGARRLYERLGFEVVGELHDYIVKGHSEFFLRKTIGPQLGFAPSDSPIMRSPADAADVR
jgi:[ribosomal protein S18]-alanine N-acetyltransferase